MSPTNNLAEQALRAIVILRKLTFGSRTRAGAKRLGTMMTVIETAKRQGKNVLKFLGALFRDAVPPGRTHWRYQEILQGVVQDQWPPLPRALYWSWCDAPPPPPLQSFLGGGVLSFTDWTKR